MSWLTCCSGISVIFFRLSACISSFFFSFIFYLLTNCVGIAIPCYALKNSMYLSAMICFFYCWRALARQHTILFNRAKNPKIFGCKTQSLCSRRLSGTIETTITRTSHGYHIFRDHFARGNLTHAVTARKQISTKFSFMEKSVSGFIWAADKDTLTLITFEPRLVLAFLRYPLLTILITISRQCLSLRPHCNSRFLFIKDLLLFLSSVMQSVRYWVLT